jgi:hypothetical protein
MKSPSSRPLPPMWPRRRNNQSRPLLLCLCPAILVYPPTAVWARESLPSALRDALLWMVEPCIHKGESTNQERTQLSSYWAPGHSGSIVTIVCSMTPHPASPQPCPWREIRLGAGAWLMLRVLPYAPGDVQSNSFTGENLICSMCVSCTLFFNPSTIN